MITNRQKYFIITYISQALFLGVGYSLILRNTNNDSWISFIIGTLLGLIYTLIIKKILDYKRDKTLLYILEENAFLKYITRLLLILLPIILINEVYFIIQEFAKSYFLTNSNSFYILLPLLILAIYISFKNYQIFSYLCECLFPIGLVLLLFAGISLIFKIDISNIKPILNHSYTSLIKSIFYYFVFSTSPLILLLDLDFNDNKISKYYFISSIVLLIIFIFLIGILGPFLTIIYRFPEYMILREISMFNFIEKIENIIAIAWIIDEFCILSLSSLFLKRMLPKKNNSYLFVTIMIIIFILSCVLFSSNYMKNILYLYFPYVLGTISILIILSLFMHILRN